MRWLGLGAILLAGGWFSQPIASPTEDPTYLADIAPVFAKKCVPCHTEDGVAPFPLETYKQVQNRAILIRYVLMQGKMPPLGASSDSGNLRAIHRMSDAELLDFQNWVHAGSPQGSGVQPELRTKPIWPPRDADLVVKGGESFKVKEEGVPYSAEIRVPLNLEKPRRIRAFEFRPKVGRSWRRMIVAKAYPADEKKQVFTQTGLPSSRIIGSRGLGAIPWRLPSGMGVLLQPGDDLAVIPLWQPSGKVESGEFELALYFDDEANTQPEWQTMGRADFVIPPQDGFTDLHSTTTLADDIEIISILPEARRYARLIRLVATLPSGREDVVFMVRNWDYEWAGSYNFEKPVRLPKGTRLDLTMTYDNSGHALGEIRTEADPVRFGPRLDDELFWLHFQFRRL